MGEKVLAIEQSARVRDFKETEMERLLRSVLTTLHASRSSWAQHIFRNASKRYEGITGRPFEFL